MENDIELSAHGEENIVAEISDNDIETISLTPLDIDVKPNIASRTEQPAEQSPTNQPISSVQNSELSECSNLGQAGKYSENSSTRVTTSMSAIVCGIPSAVEPDPLHENACRTLYVGNLERNITDETLMAHFGSFGHILEVDVKGRDKRSPFAFIQYTNIDSVAAAIRAYQMIQSSTSQDTQGNCLEGWSKTPSAGSNPSGNSFFNSHPLASSSEPKLKINWGKSKCNNKLWIGALPDSCSEEYILSQIRATCFSVPDDVTEVIYDQKYDECIVVFKTNEAAQLAQTQIKSRALTFPMEQGQLEGATRVQVDYCSENLYDFFVDRKSGRASIPAIVSNTEVITSSITEDAQHTHSGSTAASDLGPSKLAEKSKSVQNAPSLCKNEMALSEALGSSNQSTVVNTCPTMEIAQQPDAHQERASKRKHKVKLPGKLFNEHAIRNVKEVKLVLKDCRPNASDGIEDVQMVTGRVLYPPTITYDVNGHDRAEVHQYYNMKWKNPPNRRFLLSAQFPQSWVVAIFQGWNVNACSDFIKTLVKTAQRRGMRATPPKEYDMFESWDIKYIREKFEYYKKHDVQYVMFFTKDKLETKVKPTMKLMEVEFGITTQHVPEESMEKKFLFVGQVLMQLNLRLGGINHGLSTSNDMITANRFTHEVVKQEWFPESRMFIGMDVNHASGQMGEKSIEPTIVSMAYTVGHPLKMRGTYWTQQPRESCIQPTQFISNLISALHTYHSEVHRFPQHIMVFRGGVSEGEYQKMATVEFSAFEAAFKELKQKDIYFQPPSVTIISVRQQSKYRIVPAQVDKRGRSGSQNVNAGTVVDEQLVNPLYTEFLLVPHHMAKGIACPSRYTVVVDTCNPRVPLEELEHVSYYLCYAHGVECSPVSVPAPLIAAVDLKKRGRTIWKVANFKDDPSLEDVRFNGDGSEQFFIDMTNALKPSIPTKFWA